MIINPINVIHLLVIAFNSSSYKNTSINLAEQNLAENVKDLILSSTSTTIVDSFDTLDFDDDDRFDTSIVPDEDEHIYTDDESVCPRDILPLDLEYKVKTVKYWKSGKKRKRTFEAVQNKFKKLKTRSDLYRWDEEVTTNGTKFDKLHVITAFTHNKFLISRNKGYPVRDYNIKQWSMICAKEKNYTFFKASKKWVDNFKHKFNIGSRKITRFRSSVTEAREEDLHEKLPEFIEDVREKIEEIGAENVYNTDQSGFNIEIAPSRTLSHIGEKATESIVQSLSATTHSYTIQPIISASGKLLSPLLINLQEVKGFFGERVQRNMFRAKNLYITASKSGKLTKEHVSNWTRDVFSPAVGNNTVLLIDSWRGQCENTILAVKPQYQNISILTIPEGGTKYVQPLDVFTFRQYKDFVKKFTDNAMINENNIVFHIRNEILKLQSLTFNQFSAPIYQKMFQYAWTASGFLDEHPGNFITPAKFSFNNDNPVVCDICGEVAFIKCAYCNKTLCFKHFYTDYHYHNDSH